MNHAIRRAWERYGLSVSLEELTDLGRRIAEGQSVLLGCFPCGRQRHLSDLAGHPVVVIWSPVTRQVVTFLPRESQSWRSAKRAKMRKAIRARRAAERPA